jgi:tetratricopeptide (TPR) repeat protein
MSAGEFFDLIRPAFLVLAALLSTWVLVNAQRGGFGLYISLAWALATLLLPLVVFPIYLAVKLQRYQPTKQSDPVKTPRAWFLTPVLYLTLVLTFIAISEHRESNTVDMHLARATQAKLAGDRRRSIGEYKAALAIEDDPHTRKLLGIEFSDDGDWAAALAEFRLAERGGEPDNLLPFRIAQLLDALNQPNQALMEYKKFFYGDSCVNARPDYRCEVARRRLEEVAVP